MIRSDARRRPSWMPSHWRCLASFSRAQAHEWTNQGLLISRDNRLYLVRELADPNPEPVGLIPWSPGPAWLCRVRFLDRVLKYSVQRACPVGEGWLVQNRTGWWRVDRTGVSRVSAPCQGMPLQTGLCREHGSGCYLADYPDNPQRLAVRIHHSPDGRHFRTAHVFPAGAIRHVHGVLHDTFRSGRIWVLTGDRDDESRFYWSDDGLASLHPLPCHGQQTRAVSLAFLAEDRLLWGMDSPSETSWVLCWGPDFRKPPEKVVRLPGPAYYMCRNQAGGIYLGTTAEPGAGVAGPFATVWACPPGGAWRQIAAFRSDAIPQHAIVYFPRGLLPENFVVFSLRGVRWDDGRLFVVRDESL